MYEEYEMRHRQKAQYWLSRGLAEYAEGSLRKASKWQQKRREFDYCFNGAYPKTALEDMMDDFMREKSQKIANIFADTLMGE